MNIEVWFDVACPFCYISKRRLAKALEDFPHKYAVTISYRSLELNPDAALYDGTNYYEAVMSEQKISNLRAKMFTDNINRQAKDVGLTYNYDDLKQTNTFDAHRLIKLAEQTNHEEIIIENLFHAHFTKGKDVGDLITLLHIATKSGLDKEEVQKVLDDNTIYANEVRQDEEEAEQKNVSGVPFLIVNDTYTLAGAQPVIAFTRMLQKAWSEAEVDTKLQETTRVNENDIMCVGDSCTLAPKST